MACAKDDFRSLTGPQKAAIFMLAIGQEHSTKLFASMDDEEIKEMSQTIDRKSTRLNSSHIQKSRMPSSA